MKKIFLTLNLLVAFVIVNTSLHAQVITTTESRCVNTGEVEITGTVGAGGPYQLSLVTYPAAYTTTGTQLANTLPDTFTALFPGNYVMKVIDRNGAVFNYPFSITSTYVLPGNNDYLPTATAVTNCAAPNGSIQGVLSNGRAPYTYTIVSGPAQVGTINSTGTFTGLPAGEYQVQAADSCENLQTRNVTVAANATNYTITGGIINKINCDSFSLDALTITPSLPAGVSYQIIDHYSGHYSDITGTALPIRFAAKDADITGGYIEIILSNGCGVLAGTDAIRTIANDWGFTATDVTVTCAAGTVLNGVTTTGTITAPYTTTITPYDPNNGPVNGAYTAPQTVTSYPYTVTGIDPMRALLSTVTTITDACGASKSIINDMTFVPYPWNNFHFTGCDSSTINLEPKGAFTPPITYEVYLSDWVTFVTSNTTGSFTLPDGAYGFSATDACGKNTSTGIIPFDHKWKLSINDATTGCDIGALYQSVSVPGRSMGVVNYTQYEGVPPITASSVVVATQNYTGPNNGAPSNAINDAAGWMYFVTYPGHTYTYVAIDTCGKSDTVTYTVPAGLGHQLTQHTATVKTKCINKGDIYIAFTKDGGPLVVAVGNINQFDPSISTNMFYEASNSNQRVATDLPLGTYLVKYYDSYCGEAYAVFDTVVVAPYVQPKVLTAQSFPPCVGGGNPVIVRASDGVGPYMYEIINSTPSHFTAPPQSKSVFTLPSNQTTVTVRVIDACLNSTTRTVAITRAPAPFIWSNPAAFTACSLPFNYSLFIDSLYDGSVYEWTKITGTGAGSTVISDRPSLPLTFNSIADTATYQVRVTVPNTCFEQISQFSVPNVVLTCLPSISGNVFDDGNGLTDSTVNGTGTNATVLNAVLVNSSNQVVASVPVSADGTYNFINVAAGTYSVVLSTTAGTVGSAAPGASLPTGWLNTGENLGTGSGSDGAVNGTLPNIVVTNTDVTNANFGIEQIPVANNVTAPSQLNPGGTVQVTVPTLNGTDPEDGTYDGTSGINTILINTLPTNAILYYDGTVVTAGQTIVNYDPTKLTVNPNDGVLTVSFTYSEVDAAGISSTPAIVSMPFTIPVVNVSGNVFNDANGLTDNTVNGTGTNAGGLNAVLVNSSNQVVASVPVGADGTYNFTNVSAGTYSVVLSTTAGIAGNAAPAAALPAGWINTGEHLGNSTGNDGTVNGTLPNIVVTNADVINANFGIEQPPVANNVTAPSQVNPGGIVQVTVPALNGTDGEDGVYNGISNVNTIVINTLPSTGILYYNGVAVTAGQSIPNYNPSLLTVDPNAGAVTVTFTYSEVDAAGVSSNPAVVTMSFTTLSLSGNVFNDGNGLTDNTVNGTAVNGGDIDAIAAGTQQVYVNLLDNGGKVIATTAVAADGSYVFTGLNAGNYSVQLSTNQGTASQSAPATQLPANWVNTGENLGAASGNDGTVNGILPSIVLSTTDITNANFGIEQLPNSVIKTAAYAINTPGVQYAVPGLTGTDAEDGSYADGNTYIIKTLPANAVLYYNGVAVTAGQTISNFNTALLTIDPANATLVSSFTYASVDAAGNQDPSPASVTITWSGVLPITLLDFSANKNNTVVALKWTTGQEINSSYMEVQRSADGNSFSPIGSVATANTGTQHNYSLNDMKPLNGSNYYRLKLVSRDGTIQYSNVRMIVFEAFNEITVYPNPFESQIKISFTESWINKQVQVQVIDQLGQVVLNSSIAKAQQSETLQLSLLPNGIYTLKLYTTGNPVVTKKIQVKK